LARNATRLPDIAWPYVIIFDALSFAALITLLLVTWRADAINPGGGLAEAQKMAQPPSQNAKRIAFSIDDLPRGPGAFLDLKQRPQIFIDAMKAGGIKQAVFFANPARVSPINEGTKTAAMYAAAGHLLANHTANHIPLSSASAASFLADVDLAETWLKQQRNYRPWIRYPQLDEGGKDLAKRDAVRAGLKQRGIRNGYVTADGWDWFMESRTLAAKRAGKPMDQNGLRNLFVETHVQSAEFSHTLSKRLFGRAPVQMMLLHETDLAAMYIDDLANALRAKGWEIVSADSVYTDPIAAMEPKTGVANGTWLEMHAWDKGLKGERWFPRNDTNIATKLFATQVLRE
jgi:peptidoglycan-N-acetylglucosamine deacetylase